MTSEEVFCYSAGVWPLGFEVQSVFLERLHCSRCVTGAQPSSSCALMWVAKYGWNDV